MPISMDPGDKESHMQKIHDEMLKRIVYFLAFPAFILFASLLWLSYDWPGLFKALVQAQRPKKTLSQVKLVK